VFTHAKVKSVVVTYGNQTGLRRAYSTRRAFLNAERAQMKYRPYVTNVRQRWTWRAVKEVRFCLH